MYMAGIYRMESGRPVFAILTRGPADNISFIHNRMPVILPSEAVRDWINPDCDSEKILRYAVTEVGYRQAADMTAGMPIQRLL